MKPQLKPLLKPSCALLLSLFTVSSWAKQNQNPELENIFKKAAASPSVPGINVSVADRTGVLWAKGFGFADIENNVKMTHEHKMRIGSVAKLFATAAMMRLYDQQKLNLDNPITNYVSSWPKSHSPLTLRQLANHTSGIRHYRGEEYLINQTFESVDESLNIFKQDTLLFKPGTSHSYSTYAWSLLSAGLEGADGKRDFEQLMTDEVFHPLNMTDSSFDHQYKLIPNRQRPYEYENGQLLNARQTDHSYKWAGGGILATPSDVSRFAAAHSEEGFLSQNSLKEIFTPSKLNNGETINFGVGWILNFDRYKSASTYRNNKKAQELMASFNDVAMHSGGSIGGITMTILCREHATAVTVVKNVSGERSADVFYLALQSLGHFHNKYQ